MRWFGLSVIGTLLLVVGLLVVGGPAEPAAAQQVAGENMLSHMVYFKLKDGSPAAKQKMLDACRKYLSDHPGTVFFGAGTLVADLTRPVNDRDWDIALNVVFKDRAAHDAYQVAEKHKQFIEESKDNWEKVRVFDATLAGK